MAYEVLIANVPIKVGGKWYRPGSELPQKELSKEEIDGLVTPQYEGDKCRAHWEMKGKGKVDEDPKPEPNEKPKSGKGK